MIRTLIAERTSLIRAGLVALLSGTHDIEVVAEVQRSEQMVRASRAALPDVAVLAAALPGADGYAAARALHAELPACHSLIMGEQCDPAGLRRAIQRADQGYAQRAADIFMRLNTTPAVPDRTTWPYAMPARKLFHFSALASQKTWQMQS